MRMARAGARIVAVALVLTWSPCVWADDEDAAALRDESAGEMAPLDDTHADMDLDPGTHGGHRDDDGDGDGDAPAENLEPVRNGVQVQGTLGLSDCTGGFCSNGDESRVANSRIGLGLALSGWYRLIPMVSAGIDVHYNLLGLADRGLVSSSASYWAVEVGGRFHPLQRGRIEPFAGLSFGYLAYAISSDFTELRYTQNEATNSVFFAISAGAEYYLAPRMSLGGVLKVSLPIWIKQCFETLGAEDCDAVGDMLQIQKDALPSAFWYLGGTFSYHLGG